MRACARGHEQGSARPGGEGGALRGLEPAARVGRSDALVHQRDVDRARADERAQPVAIRHLFEAARRSELDRGAEVDAVGVR